MAEKSLRFCIASGEKGLRAASWKLWTPSTKRDIYLAARELGSVVKISMHESGKWHLAYDPNFFEKNVPEVKRGSMDRFVEKWTRPTPLVPGVTLALRIVTPWTALTPRDLPNSKVIRVAPPREGRAREICMVLIEPLAGLSGWPDKCMTGTELVGSYQMVGDASIWVVHSEIPCPDFSKIQGGPLTFFNGVSKTDISSHSRAIVFGRYDDGSRVVYDLVGESPPKMEVQV